MNLCLTVPGARYTAGQRLDVQPCNGGQDQEFLRVPSVSAASPAPELVPYGDGQICVGLSGSVKNGAAVVLKSCTRKKTQAWDSSDAWFGWWSGRAIVLHPYQPGSTPVMALAASRLGGTGATAVTQPFKIAHTAQAWVPGTSANRQVRFRLAARTGWCLDAPSASTVTVQPCDGSQQQEFTWHVMNALYSQLESSAQAGLCLTRGTGTGSVPVTLTACSAAASSQLWESWG